MALAYLTSGSVRHQKDDFAKARDISRWIRANQEDLENLPEESELRFLETCLTMEIHSSALRAMLTSNEPTVQEEESYPEFQGLAIN